jgi:thiamine biosynthesis lipoprotein
MGTFVTVSVEGRGGLRVARAVDAAFVELGRLERMFTRFSPVSALSRLNAAGVGRAVPAPPEFAALLRLALRVRRASRGAFDPFHPRPTARERPLVFTRRGARVRREVAQTLDLSGIAKGFAADRAAALLARRLPGRRGAVDAGGDARFFGPGSREVSLRLGDPHRPVLRSLATDARAVASSSPGYARALGLSSTRYGGIRAGRGCAVALAPNAALADALTKVGLIADAATAEACARLFGARILAFDARGRLVGSFGG